MEPGNKKIYSLMVMATIFWAGAFIAGKFGVSEFSPLALTFFRFLFASIIIFLIMLKYEKNWKLKKEDWGVILILGIVGMIGYHILFFSALKYTTSTNSSVIAATNPLITSVLASIFVGETLGLKRVAAILLALSGVVLTITNWDLSILTNLSFNKGDLLMLCAVVCWAAYSVLSKKVMPKYSPLILTTYSFLVCTVILLPFVIILEDPIEFIHNTSWYGWSAIIYMAIFPTVIGYLIQQMSFQVIGASRTNIFINLVPVFSIILAVLILHEHITTLKLLSAGIIITGVYWNSRIKDKLIVVKTPNPVINSRRPT